MDSIYQPMTLRNTKKGGETLCKRLCKNIHKHDRAQFASVLEFKPLRVSKDRGLRQEFKISLYEKTKHLVKSL